MSAPFSADGWNELVRDVMRAHPLPGLGCEIEYTSRGAIISGEGSTAWHHPWHIHASWRVDPEKQPLGGEWTAQVMPGFVNAREVTIEVEREVEEGVRENVHVPLTDEEAPLLALGSFRDPAAPNGIEATLTGQIVIKPGEGYPPFFDQLGVVPVAKGGEGFGALEEEPDPKRTRQIRACDIVLVTPRLAARQEVILHDPQLEGQTIEIGTTFDNSALTRAQSRHWLRATAKWEPARDPTPLDRLMGTAVEFPYDELKLATVWLISPPDAGSEALPDATWTAYPQHFVFWNLNHASRSQMPGKPFQPLTFLLPLAAGVAQPIINSLLQPINDASALIHAYLNAADFRGRYWSI